MSPAARCLLLGAAVVLLASCGSSSTKTFAKSENTAQMCQDGQDNDGDKIVDCQDPDCWEHSFCPRLDRGLPDAPPRSDRLLRDARLDAAIADRGRGDARRDAPPPDVPPPDKPAAPDSTPLKRSLSFDGVDDFVGLGGPIKGSPLAAVTIEVWIKLKAVPTGAARVFYDGADGEFTLHFDDTGILRFGIKQTTGWRYESSNFTASSLVGAWHHVAATWSMASATMRVYLDGTPGLATGVPTQPLVSAAGGSDPTIGAYCSTSLGHSEFFPGHIDEVRLWSLVRTQTEITGSMYTTLSGSEGGLIGYWRLDDGAGQKAKDSSPSKKDGTLSSPNGPAWSVDVPF